MRFAHGLKLGDVIYALAAVKAAGGGDVILYANQHFRRPMLSVLPFVRSQPYVRSATFVPQDQLRPHMYDVNLQDYLLVARRLGHGVDLVKCHLLAAGLPAEGDYAAPWLTAGTVPGVPTVVMHRSHRNHGLASWDFVRNCRDSVAVGTDKEALGFVKRGIPHRRTPSFEELAAVINSCRVFVGNQSSPLALAVGLGKTRLIDVSAEKPDCLFGHPNEYRLACRKVEDRFLLMSLKTKLL